MRLQPLREGLRLQCGACERLAKLWAKCSSVWTRYLPIWNAARPSATQPPLDAVRGFVTIRIRSSLLSSFQLQAPLTFVARLGTTANIARDRAGLGTLSADRICPGQTLSECWLPILLLCLARRFLEAQVVQPDPLADAGRIAHRGNLEPAPCFAARQSSSPGSRGVRRRSRSNAAHSLNRAW